MSHFTVLVFSRDNIDEMLAPYNENEAVEEYFVEELTIKHKQEFMDYYNEHYPEESKGKSFSELYELFGERWNGNSYRKNENDIWCSYSSYNPDSKWDWYEIGGRWYGEIPNNCCKVNKLPANFIPFAFIDEDGKWHEKGTMGWWAITTNEKLEEVWETEFREALKGYKGYVTLVDCHI